MIRGFGAFWYSFNYWARGEDARNRRLGDMHTMIYPKSGRPGTLPMPVFLLEALLYKNGWLALCSIMRAWICCLLRQSFDFYFDMLLPHYYTVQCLLLVVCPGHI